MLSALLQSGVFWLAVAACGGLIALSGTSLRATMVVLLRLVVIGLPVLLIFIPSVAIVSQLPGFPDALRPALIAALVVVIGWMVTFLFREVGRQQDQVDLMLSLRAEIFVVREQITPESTLSYLQDIRTRFDAAQEEGTSFTPFVTMPPVASVFRAVAPQITRLPSETVEPVIQFYALLSDIEAFVLDLRSEPFKALPMDRSRIAYEDYYDTRLVLSQLADDALLALDQAIGVKNGRRESDSPVSAQSARQ